MRINLDKPVHDENFEVVRIGEKPAADTDDERPELTLRKVISTALFSDVSPKDNKKIDEEEKWNRFKLADKVQNAKIGDDFEQPELDRIRQVCELRHGALIYGQVRLMLEDAQSRAKAESAKPNGRDKAKEHRAEA